MRPIVGGATYRRTLGETRANGRGGLSPAGMARSCATVPLKRPKAGVVRADSGEVTSRGGRGFDSRRLHSV